MRRKQSSLAILRIAICLSISICTATFAASAAKVAGAEVFANSFFENQNRSIAVYEEAISPYRSISGQGIDEVVVYSDDFAGAFIDDNGFLNIALVQSWHSASAFEGQVLYRQYEFSYNYLLKIRDMAVDIATAFGIHAVGIGDKENRVNIYISGASEVGRISHFFHEQTDFDETAIAYVIESCIVSNNPSYGGESVSAAGLGGTICVLAIDNTTGQLGILTNEHVVPTGTASNYRGHWNGSTFSANVALGTALRGQHAGTIDASFVPYTTQANWEISPYSKYNTTTNTNVRLGNNNQIIQGRAIRKIGQTTGITNGTITDANTWVTLNYGTQQNPNNQTITNVFRYSNESRGGDSGGPVYFNDGTDLHLIGIHFAGPFDPNTATFGIACRIQNVINTLNVTPITNDSFVTSNLSTTSVSLNGLNFNPSGALVIPTSLNGRTVTAIGNSAFANQTGMTNAEIPNTITSIGASAFASCSNLTKITIPNGVTSIGNSAFSFCISLGTVSIERPSSWGLTTLGAGVFTACPSLYGIYVPDSNSITAYKGATNWSSYSNFIKTISSVSVSGSNANPTGAGSYVSGNLVYIHAGNAPNGYAFTGWTVNSGSASLFNSKDATTYFTMPPNAVSVTANWAQAYPVTVNGSYHPSPCNGSFAVGSTVHIYAGVNPGYTFAGWTVSPSSVSLSNPSYDYTTFNMPPNAVTVTANWTLLPTVTVNGSNTSPTGAGSYAPNSTVTIHAGTKSGYVFSGWSTSSSGVSFANSKDATTTFKMPANAVTVTANWNQLFSVSVSGSYANSTGAGSFTSGSTVYIDAGSRPGYTFTGWTVNSGGISLPNSSSASFTMPPNAVSVTANWTQNGAYNWIEYGESTFHPYDSGSLYRVPYELLYFKNNVGYTHNTYAYFDNLSDACYLADSWWWQPMDYIDSYDGGDLYYYLEWSVQYYDNGEWYTMWKK